jgi:hypothetical protein
MIGPVCFLITRAIMIKFIKNVKYKD